MAYSERVLLIGAFAFNIVGIQLIGQSAAEHMAFATQFAVVKACPLLLYILATLLWRGRKWRWRWGGHRWMVDFLGSCVSILKSGWLCLPLSRIGIAQASLCLSFREALFLIVVKSRLVATDTSDDCFFCANFGFSSLINDKNVTGQILCQKQEKNRRGLVVLEHECFKIFFSLYAKC